MITYYIRKHCAWVRVTTSRAIWAAMPHAKALGGCAAGAALALMMSDLGKSPIATSGHDPDPAEIPYYPARLSPGPVYGPALLPGPLSASGPQFSSKHGAVQARGGQSEATPVPSPPGLAAIATGLALAVYTHCGRRRSGLSGR